MSEREEVKAEFTTKPCPLTRDGVVRMMVDLDAMADEIVRLRSQLAAVKRDYDTLLTRAKAGDDYLSNLMRERDEARREREALRDELAAAEEQRDHWRGAYEGAMQGCEDLARESLKFKAEAEALRHRAERAERECERMREVIELARAQSVKADEWLSCECPPDCPHDFEYDMATTRTESAVRALDADAQGDG